MAARPRNALPVLLVLVGVALPLAALGADIFMGTDSNGVITFTDTPPSGDNTYSLFMEDLGDRPNRWAQVNPALMQKNLDLFDGLILSASSRHQVSPELVKAMVLVESGMNPKARSPKGAMGLMQLMPGTAKDMGVDDAFDPEENINGGTRYIRKMLDTFPDQRHAIAAYNAGPTNVKRHKGVPPFKETQYYVQKVLKYYQHFRTQQPLVQR